jgi:hypothetical protein
MFAISGLGPPSCFEISGSATVFLALAREKLKSGYEFHKFHMPDARV